MEIIDDHEFNILSDKMPTEPVDTGINENQMEKVSKLYSQNRPKRPKVY